MAKTNPSINVIMVFLAPEHQETHDLLKDFIKKLNYDEAIIYSEEDIAYEFDDTKASKYINILDDDTLSKLNVEMDSKITYKTFIENEGSSYNEVKYELSSDLIRITCSYGYGFIKFIKK